jgi:hypothetical protein
MTLDLHPPSKNSYVETLTATSQNMTVWEVGPVKR